MNYSDHVPVNENIVNCYTDSIKIKYLTIRELFENFMHNSHIFIFLNYFRDFYKCTN